MNKQTGKIFLVAAAALLLGGCSARTANRVRPPALPTSYAAAQGDSGISSQPGDLTTWWQNFNDPVLDSLVERSLKGNYDLKIAQSRVREARASHSYTSATRKLPTIPLSGGYSDSYRAGSHSGGLFQTGFDASYELDLFGSGRASVRAAEADAQATEEGMRNTLVSVVAEMARNYLELRAAQQRLEVAQMSLAAQEETLRLAELRRAAGLTSEFDTTRAKAQAESTRAGIPLLEAQVQRSINAIALLAGEQPAELQGELSQTGNLPAVPLEIPTGLPSALLRRRPDVRQAERNIAGAAARVGVSVSNFYPKFSLTSGGGGQSSALLNILSGAARIWTFGSSFSWGLLNYSATKANIDVAEAREQQSIVEYEKAVLTALTDVETALAAFVKEKERQPSLEQAVAANRKALELANIRYEKGLSNFLDVLDAQRSLYSAEDTLTQSRANVSTNLISLYKALGGGW